jgi:dTMP kinase
MAEIPEIPEIPVTAPRATGACFVTFEGLDGSGKSSHLRRIGEALARRGRAALTTHEPGGTPLGDGLRSLFKDRRFHVTDGTVELLLVFAGRRQHLIEVIDPALSRGEVVLCDRFTDSTYAYQGAGRLVPLATLEEVDRLATGSRRPDRTILFDLPAAQARERGRSRGRRARGAVDRLDDEDLAFYERVRAGYLDLAAREPGRVRVVDSGGPLEATAAAVRRALADLLPEVDG